MQPDFSGGESKEEKVFWKLLYASVIVAAVIQTTEPPAENSRSRTQSPHLIIKEWIDDDEDEDGAEPPHTKEP